MCDVSASFFIDKQSCLPNVSKIIIGGTAHLKDKMLNSSSLDPRLVAITSKETLSLAYGGMRGLKQAIEVSTSFLCETKVKEEQKQLQFLFDSMSRGFPVAFGFEQVLHAHNLWAIEHLFIYENLNVPIFHFHLFPQIIEANDPKFETFPKILTFTLDKNQTLEQVWSQKFEEKYGKLGQFYEVKEEKLIDWFLQNKNGAKIYLISDSSEIAQQFIEGLNGIAAIVTKPEVLDQFQQNDDEDDEEELDQDF